MTALVATLPLLVFVGCAAPHGNAYRWLEIDERGVLIGFALALLVMLQRSRALVWLVLLGPPLISFGYLLMHEAAVLQQFHAMDHFGHSTDLLVRDTFLSVGCWAPALWFASLTWLANTHRVGVADAHDHNLLRLGRWLGVVGGAGLLLTLINGHWYTLENLKGDGTYMSGCAWPDTKVLAAVAAGLTLVAAATMTVRASGRRKARRKFVDAVAHGSVPGWRIGEGPLDVPTLLDSPGPAGRILYAVKTTEGDGPYRESGVELAIARVP